MMCTPLHQAWTGNPSEASNTVLDYMQAGDAHRCQAVNLVKEYDGRLRLLRLLRAPGLRCHATSRTTWLQLSAGTNDAFLCQDLDLEHANAAILLRNSPAKEAGVQSPVGSLRVWARYGEQARLLLRHADQVAEHVRALAHLGVECFAEA